MKRTLTVTYEWKSADDGSDPRAGEGAALNAHAEMEIVKRLNGLSESTAQLVSFNETHTLDYDLGGRHYVCEWKAQKGMGDPEPPGNGKQMAPAKKQGLLARLFG